MSGRYFHVDRRGDLEVGARIDRREPAVGTAEERTLLADLFDGGAAPHGSHYCTMDLYGADDADLWDLACELVFELVRRERFPDRPSRFASVFGFATRSAVDRFVARHVEGDATLYAVSGGRTFEGDMRLVDAPHLPGAVARAHYYWEGATDSEDPLWEVLLEPPVTVERVVEGLDPE